MNAEWTNVSQEGTWTDPDQTDLRILSYRIHSRTFSATCRLDCVNVLNV